MKKLLFLLLAVTISFPGFANTSIEKTKEGVSCALLSGKKNITKYYQNKSCKSAMNFYDQVLLFRTKTIMSNNQELSDFCPMERAFDGFVNGVYEQDQKCIKQLSKHAENRGDSKTIYGALWSVYGDGSIREDKAIKNLLNEEAYIRRYDLPFLSGYYYATGDKRVIEIMKFIIQAAMNDYCFSKVDSVNFGQCPTKEQVQDFENELKNIADNKPGAKTYLKDLFSDAVKKSKTEDCIFGPCPDAVRIYFAAEFLKEHEPDWYNKNVKNWLPKKEKIYLKHQKGN